MSGAPGWLCLWAGQYPLWSGTRPHLNPRIVGVGHILLAVGTGVEIRVLRIRVWVVWMIRGTLRVHFVLGM